MLARPGIITRSPIRVLTYLRATPLDFNPPIFTSISPNTGGAGTFVTITGSGFSGVSSVYLDETELLGMIAVSNTTITGTTPAGTGAADLMIISYKGVTIERDAFTYSGLGE